MIKLLRVDDKLLHGRVAFSWVRNLKIHTIIIADDRIAYDEFSKMTLGLSKPQGVNLKIVEVKEAIHLLRGEVKSDFNVMAIVNSIENGQRIMSQIKEIRSLNIGVLRERYDTNSYSQDVSLNETEIALCKEIIASGCEVEMRLTYHDKKLDIAKLLNK